MSNVFKYYNYMGFGSEKIDNHIEGFKKEIGSVSLGSPDVFFNWFDDCGFADVDTNFIVGKCEFIFNILMPLIGLIKNPFDKTILEIGYGGGRLLAAAAGVFKTAIGVDIHDSSEVVAKELRGRGISNFQLLQNDGKHIPMGDCGIDLIYSFIVLQHVEKIDILESYIQESYRVLKHGGYAVLFFGRMFNFSLNTKSNLLYALDAFLGKVYRRGYKELRARVNCTNLKVTMGYAQSMCKQKGFMVVGCGVSRKIPSLKYGGQNYLILKKV